MKLRLNLLPITLLVVCNLVGTTSCHSEPSPPLAEGIPIKYNNDSLTVDLGVGLWGIPVPMDYNNDGLMDLFVACPDTPYKGIYYFENIGTKEEPLFAKPVKKSSKSANNIKLSWVNGSPKVLMQGAEYIDFATNFLEKKVDIPYQGAVLCEGYKKSRSKMWSYVDWDGDGDQDIVAGVDTWDDYGWDNAFDKDGKWCRGPLHGYVFLLENIDGKYYNRSEVKAANKIIDVYGAPNPNVYDFDFDGDLDLICGEFVDRLTWFENIGTRNNPQFTEGRILTNNDGEIKFFLEMIVPVGVDFNGDGLMDLVVGDEDGRVAYLKNTGVVKGRMPQFESPVYFRQISDDLKFGALSTPCSVDWDADGKEDLIVGNSAGNIGFIKNLSGGDNPTWAEPKFLTVGGEPIRIQAGYNGSIQGPCESKWGYTVLSVADWDGDGLKDIIINSIWGKIEWYKNIGSADRLEVAPAQDVKVAWEGKVPKPIWNWWDPSATMFAAQWRTTPVAIDWNSDGLMDLVVMDHEGYLALFERFADEYGELWLKPGQRIFYGTNCSEYSNKEGVVNAVPGLLRLNSGEAGRSGRRKISLVDWDQDGDLDLIVDSKNCCLFENVKTENGKTYFEYKGDLMETKLAGHTTCPTPIDWNNDGVSDILLGAEDGHFYVVKNKKAKL